MRKLITITITITATADRRFIDGYQAGALAETARVAFANPARFGP